METTTPLAMTQADFARLHSVTKKTVTAWKHQGYVTLTSSGLVDVAASNARLRGRPDVNRGGVSRHLRSGQPRLETAMVDRQVDRYAPGAKSLSERVRDARVAVFGADKPKAR